jgi:uncharacterized membrane protein YqjE
MSLVAFVILGSLVVEMTYRWVYSLCSTLEPPLAYVVTMLIFGLITCHLMLRRSLTS